MFQQKKTQQGFVNNYERRGLANKDLNSVSKLDESYASELNWYTQAPEEEITIDEFESFAGDRLCVLKALEAANIRNKVGKELEEIFLKVSREHLPLAQISSTADNFNIMRKDLISHFILRLAFCKSEDLRAWFVKYESTLFTLRYNQALPSTRSLFIRKLGYNFEKVSELEKQQLKSQLNTAKFGGYGNDFDKEDFFKIPFEKVPELISGRQVFIKGGYAYVPNEYSLSWILGEFKNILRKGLLNLSKALPNIDEDERLLPILNSVANKSFSTYDVSKSQKSNGKISSQDVQKASVHFPLCMSNSYKGLCKDKHLKHGARMQFGLFLKGIGLPLEEALEFWRRSFSRMTDDEFKKGYAYNIRHNYGQEGNRKDYTPYGCEKIINSNFNGPDQHHGCPFKQFSFERLKNEIQDINPIVTMDDLREITDMVKKKHYTIACTKYFELTRSNINNNGMEVSLPEPIVHPNQFYELSVKISSNNN